MVRGQRAHSTGDISDLDYESISVRSVDGDRKTDPSPLLVKGDSVDLYHLDAPICGKFEEGRLRCVRRSYFNPVPISSLLDATGSQISDGAFFDGICVQQPGRALCE